MRIGGLSPRFLLQLVAGIIGVWWLMVSTYTHVNSMSNKYVGRVDWQPGSVVVDVKAMSCLGKFSCSISGYTRIPKDLYTTAAAEGEHYYLFMKRAPISQAGEVVLDVFVGQDSPAQKGAGTWLAVKGTNIWLLKGRFDESAEHVGAVTVLFGPDAVDPRPDWTLHAAPLILDNGSHLSARLTVQKTFDDPDKKTYYVRPATVPVRQDGKFKILQVADLHFSTGPGECKDSYPSDEYGDLNCAADKLTLEFVDKVLNQESPDMVVLSGDQVFGSSAPDAETAYLKAVAPFVSRGIPYAVILGNHDHQGSLSRSELMDLLESLPYSLANSGPREVAGQGNYVVEVHPFASPAAPQTSLNLFFLDSHGGNGGGLKSIFRKGEEWIHISQISYVVSEAERLAQFQRDSMAMLFQHIPLPEFDEDLSTAKVGKQREGVYAPVYNSGALDGYSHAGVSVVGVGHDHLNDFCMMDHPSGVWLCYGGGAGEGGYGGSGFVRRLRVFDVDTTTKTIKSWKVLRDGSIIDRQTLVSHGKTLD
jgi:hypothetical protein